MTTREEPSSKVHGLYRALGELYALDQTMPLSQALILLTVAKKAQGRLNRGLSGIEIGEELNMAAAKVSRNLILLQEADLIDVQRDPVDPRTKLNTLSKAEASFVAKLTAHL